MVFDRNPLHSALRPALALSPRHAGNRPWSATCIDRGGIGDLFSGRFAGSYPAFNRGLHMTTRHLLLLPGDGIGPEVMAATTAIIGWFNARSAGFSFEEDLVGGAAYDAHGQAISDATMDKALAADAVLL